MHMELESDLTDRAICQRSRETARAGEGGVCLISILNGLHMPQELVSPN